MFFAKNQLQTTSKHTRNLLAPTTRHYAISQKDVKFPYKFGNFEKKSNWKREWSMSHFHKEIISGIRLAYRGLLVSLQSEEMLDLRKMAESRLFKRIRYDLAGLKEKGYSLVIHGMDNDIDVHIKDIYKIVGGYINRDTEYSQGLTLITVPGEMPPIEFRKLAPPSLHYVTLFSKQINVIYKIVANVYTSCKLDLKNAAGETLLTAQEASEPELHEITIEGITDIIPMAKSFREIMEITRRITAQPTEIMDATVVDLDNALKGNPHKDSEYI